MVGLHDLLNLIIIKFTVGITYCSTFFVHHYWHRWTLVLAILYFYYRKSIIGMTIFFCVWLFFTCVSFYCIHFYVCDMYPTITDIVQATHFMLYGDFDFELLAEQIIKEPPVLKKFGLVVMTFLMENYFFNIFPVICVIKFIRDEDYLGLLLFLLSWYVILDFLIYLISP